MSMALVELSPPRAWLLFEDQVGVKVAVFMVSEWLPKYIQART